MNREHLVLISILILAAPASNATAPIEYAVATDQKFGSGALTTPTLHEAEFELEPSPRGTHQLILTYRMGLLASMANNGSIVFGIFFDGVEVPNCRFIIETLSGGTLQQQFVVACMGPLEASVGKHNHTISIQQVSATGALATVESWNSNIVIQAQEVEPMGAFESQIGMSAGELIVFPAIAIAGLFLWTRKDVGISLFGSLLLLFDAAILLNIYANANTWSGVLALSILTLLAFGYTVLMTAFGIKKDKESDGT